MLNNLISEFNTSYINCINRIDTASTFPHNESEIFGTYFDEFHSHKLSYIGEKEIIPLNPAILRSMLVMDLYGEDKTYKNKIFEYYTELLEKYYKQDIFSLNVNIPKKYNINDYNDYSFFANNDELIPVILNNCFKYSYKLNHDIFADNTYEIIGPLHNNKYTIIIHRFHGIYEHPLEIIYFSSVTKGTIDMFGHSDIIWKNPKYIIIHNDEIIEDYDSLNQLILEKIKIINKEGTIQECIESFNRRYELSDIGKINFGLNKDIIPKIVDRKVLIDKIIL
jgi:hypothetical protein